MLGVVSFLTDVSSKPSSPFCRCFSPRCLGASTLVLGAMEGLADFAASSFDMMSGYLSDRLGKRKSIVVFGYSLSSMAKMVLVLASTAGQVFAFRIIERLGKSIRGAPRDALLAGVSPTERRGVSFGLHKAFDKAGAILGPLLAYALLGQFGQSLGGFRKLFAAAVIPAIAAVAVLVFCVRDHAGPRRPRVPSARRCARSARATATISCPPACSRWPTSASPFSCLPRHASASR